MGSRGRLVGMLACALACVAPLSPRAQDKSGAVDTRPGTKERIAQLEFAIKGDTPPDKRRVYLHWLADLYTQLGQLDDAQGAYERILEVDPYDLATSNDYAAFLLDVRKRPADAETFLELTIGWASKADPPLLYLGDTYSLQARALRALERYDAAIAASRHAMERLDPDAAEDALRTQAQSLRALGKDDDATAAFGQLVGLAGGSDADDINALIALETKQKGSIDADAFRTQVRKLVEDARRARAESLTHGGAEMVVLEGEGHVRLEGTLRRGKGPNAVLLVPDLGSRRSVFTPYEQLLALDGITTLSIDPRGHGDSRCDSLPSYLELPADQRERIPSDIACAQRYLRDTLKIPADRIAVIVAGAASSDVEHAMHDENLGAVVVHLSPVFDPLDRGVASAIEFRPPRPTLLVVSDEDLSSIQSVDAMRAARPNGPLTVHTVHGAGHGVTILHEPEHFAWVSSWISETLPAAK